MNEPDVWWWQSDSLLQPPVAYPGVSTLHVVGKALYVNRTASSCSSDVAQLTGARVLLLEDANGNQYDVEVGASCFHVEGVIPSGVPPGTYTLLLNNNLLAGNGVSIGNITVSAPPAPAPGSCAASTVATLQSCLQSLNASGGGDLLLAAGDYAMPAGASLVIASGVRVVGAGAGVSRLLWLNNTPTSAPVALATGVGSWALYNVSLIALSPVANGVEFSSACVGCTVRGVEVTVNTSAWPSFAPRNAFVSRGASQWTFADNAVTHAGNCSTSWPGNCCFVVAVTRDALLARNSWMCGCQGYSTDTTQRLLMLSNSMSSVGGDSDGNGFSTFASPWSLQDVYAADNAWVGNPNAYKRWESMTFDGPGSAFVGPVAAYASNASGAWLTPGVGVNASDGLQVASGMLVAVMQGQGVGQLRRVSAGNGSNPSPGAPIALDAALDVPPASDTIVSVGPYRGRVVWERNTWTNGTTVQLFGTSIDCVFAGNTFVNMTAGLLGWGRMYQGGWQPSYRVLFQDNDLTCCSLLSSFSSVEPTPVPPFNFTGPFNWAHVHRGNALLGGTVQNMRGATWDSIMENNSFEASNCGGGPGTPVRPAGTWSRDNATVNVFVRGQ